MQRRIVTIFFMAIVIAFRLFPYFTGDKTFAEDESLIAPGYPDKVQQPAEMNYADQGNVTAEQPMSADPSFDIICQRIAALGVDPGSDPVLEANKISADIARIEDLTQQETLRSLLEQRMGQLR